MGSDAPAKCHALGSSDFRLGFASPALQITYYKSGDGSPSISGNTNCNASQTGYAFQSSRWERDELTVCSHSNLTATKYPSLIEKFTRSSVGSRQLVGGGGRNFPQWTGILDMKSPFPAHAHHLQSAIQEPQELKLKISG